METKRERFSLTAKPDARGTFEVLAITAGVGNGWHFDPQVLQRSLPLWEGVQCFVDHAAGRTARSVRDLGGQFRQPVWDAQQQGIRLTLQTLGPCGALVERLGREMVSGGGPAGVGFSADVGFSAHGREVVEIVRVYSLDVVIHPARGGAFLRAVEPIETPQSSNFSDTQGEMMQPEELTQSESEQAAEIRANLQGDAPVPAADTAQAVRVEMCACLLDTSLAASKLPAAAQEQVRRQFAGRVFAPEELSRVVADARQLVSALTGAASVQGPRISGMADSRDQLQSAVDDMFGAPRQPGLEAVQPARLSGIRELYLTLTGDYDLHGGYYPERARLATSADFTGLVKNALNKVVANRWAELGRAGYNWWEKVVTVEHFDSLHQITGTLVGTVGSLPTVAEGGAYTELVVGDSPETASFTKYGGYIPLTLELIDRDETRKLRAYPRELAAAGLRKISSLVAGIFTAAGGVGPNMADGGALFNSDAVSGAGGHANLGSAVLSAEAWEAACLAVYDQPLLIKNALGLYGSGPKMAVNPRYLLAPRALQLAGMRILYPSLEHAANIYSENLQRGQPGDVITVPEWTDATDWAAACDPLVAPALFVGERFGLMPEIFIAGDELSPAVFSNDEHRLKVRHFLAVWVNDFRPLFKSNAAG